MHFEFFKSHVAMGCRLVTPTNDFEPAAQQESELIHLTERPSNEEEVPPVNREESEAETEAAASCQAKDAYDHGELFNTSSSLSVGPPTVTSQLSDIIDLCEEIEEEEVQNKSEAVLERILRSQFQLEKLGDAAPPEIARLVGDIDTRFRTFLADYAGKQDTTTIFAVRDTLQTFDDELDSVAWPN